MKDWLQNGEFNSRLGNPGRFFPLSPQRRGDGETSTNGDGWMYFVWMWLNECIRQWMHVLYECDWMDEWMYKNMENDQKRRHPLTKLLTIIYYFLQKPGNQKRLNDTMMTSLVSACFVSWPTSGIRQYKINRKYFGVKTKGIYETVATVRILKSSPVIFYWKVKTYCKWYQYNCGQCCNFFPL